VHRNHAAVTCVTPRRGRQVRVGSSRQPAQVLSAASTSGAATPSAASRAATPSPSLSPSIALTTPRGDAQCLTERARRQPGKREGLYPCSRAGWERHKVLTLS